MAMRRNYIPALLVCLMLAAPLWASQHGNSGGTRGPAPVYRSSSPRNSVPRNAGPAARPMAARNGFSGAPQRANQAGPRSSAPAVNQPRAQVSQAPRQIIRGQGPHNGDWLRDSMKLPSNEQQRRLEQDQHFRQLPQQRQDQLRNRLQNFNSMPAEQRQRVLNRMEMMEHLRPEQQLQARTLFGQFSAMPPERKQMMRRTLHEMRGMPPEARERLLNSPDLRSRYSPEEIQMLHGFNGIGFATPE